MTKAKWRERITQATRDAGTYREFFDDVIDTLAGIMERRDIAEKEFKRNGGTMTVEHTNKGGATNVVKNPALVLIMECDTQALAYWRDLGLTPAGLKKINEENMKGKKTDALAEALKELA